MWKYGHLVEFLWFPKFSLQITCSHLFTVIKTLKGEKKQRVYMTLHKHCELGTSDATLDSFDIYLLNSS